MITDFNFPATEETTLKFSFGIISNPISFPSVVGRTKTSPVPRHNSDTVCNLVSLKSCIILFNSLATLLSPSTLISQSAKAKVLTRSANIEVIDISSIKK